MKIETVRRHISSLLLMPTLTASLAACGSADGPTCEEQGGRQVTKTTLMPTVRPGGKVDYLHLVVPDCVSDEEVR